jgi:hypothetical protein
MPDELDALIFSLLSKRAEDRPESAKAVSLLLSDLAANPDGILVQKAI